MPFHSPISSLSNKYSSIQEQKTHGNKYKQFLETLSINRNHNSTDERISQRTQIYRNDNYLIQRQISLQSRQDKRKQEYERIQKENLKFSQKLIHAKAYLSRSQQQIFFDKHCQIRQRLQYYPRYQSLPTINTKPRNVSHLISQKTQIDPKKSTKLVSPFTHTNNSTQTFPSNVINWNRSSISTSESHLSDFFHLK